MLIVIMLSVASSYCYVERHYAECSYSECCGTHQGQAPDLTHKHTTRMERLAGEKRSSLL